MQNTCQVLFIAHMLSPFQHCSVSQNARAAQKNVIVMKHIFLIFKLHFSYVTDVQTHRHTNRHADRLRGTRGPVTALRVSTPLSHRSVSAPFQVYTVFPPLRLHSFSFSLGSVFPPILYPCVFRFSAPSPPSLHSVSSSLSAYALFVSASFRTCFVCNVLRMDLISQPSFFLHFAV